MRDSLTCPHLSIRYTGKGERRQGTCRNCGVRVWKQETREEIRRLTAAYDYGMGYDLDDEGNSYHDYS